MAMAAKAAVNEKTQKKMERTMQNSCRLECLSQTERGWGGSLEREVKWELNRSMAICAICDMNMCVL